MRTRISFFLAKFVAFMLFVTRLFSDLTKTAQSKWSTTKRDEAHDAILGLS